MFSVQFYWTGHIFLLQEILITFSAVNETDLQHINQVWIMVNSTQNLSVKHEKVTLPGCKDLGPSKVKFLDPFEEFIPIYS